MILASRVEGRGQGPLQTAADENRMFYRGVTQLEMECRK